MVLAFVGVQEQGHYRAVRRPMRHNPNQLAQNSPKPAATAIGLKANTQPGLQPLRSPGNNWQNQTKAITQVKFYNFFQFGRPVKDCTQQRGYGNMPQPVNHVSKQTEMTP